MKYANINLSVSVEEAIRQVKNNNSKNFIWLIVKNKTGCIFEVGGNHEELKAYIPFYDENGAPKKYPYNDMVHMNFSISTSQNHPADGLVYDENKFTSIVKNKDLRKALFTPGKREEIVVVTSSKINFN